MVTVLTILVVLGLLGTLGTMFAGMLGLARESGSERSNALMRWRVLLQGVTIGLFVLLLLLTRS
jgi:Hypoxia induced protein conserved region